MANKMYSRLTKRELLELLIEESEKSERLEAELAEANEKLSVREIQIKNAGSIAEASLALNGIFEAAEEACALYKENIQRMTAEQTEANANREAESKKRAEQIVSEAKERANRIETDVRERCEKMIDLAGGEIAQFRMRFLELHQ